MTQIHQHSGTFSTQEFPSCLFRIPENGGRVIWEITNTCNYNCEYCIFSSGHQLVPSELKKEEVFKVIDQLKEYGFTHLKFTGGEPFVRQDMIEILQYATDHDFYVDISTNASLLSREKVQSLKEMGTPLVHVSLDGFNQELQEKVRGTNTFERTIQGIKKLVEAGIYVRIGSLIYKDNEQLQEEMVKFCLELGVNEVIFSRMEAVGRMRDDDSLITVLPAKVFIEEISKLKEKYQDRIVVNYSFSENTAGNTMGRCPGGSKFLYIDHLGRVSPCTWVSEFFPHYRSKANLHQESFKQLMNSEQIGSYLKMISELNQHGLGCPAKALWEIEKYEQIQKIFEGGLEENLLNAPKFAPYARLYSFTTENLAGYFSKLPLEKARILTVGASGDQFINASMLGAREIVCFDKNVLARFYAELKIEAVKTLNYEEFRSYFLRNSEQTFNPAIYQKIKPGLAPLTRLFWDRVYNYFQNNGKLIRESALFNNKHDLDEQKISYNPYLQSEENYLKAQNSLQNKTFKWIDSALENLMKNRFLPKNSFEVILLSNIADYAEKIFPGEKNYLLKFKNEIIEPLNSKLNIGGIMVLGYLYCTDQNSSQPHSQIDNGQLRNEIFSHTELRYGELDFPSAIKGLDTIAFWKK